MSRDKPDESAAPEQPNVISMSAAAERHHCARSTIWRAAQRGDLTAVDIGSTKAILKDEKWERWSPQPKGTREPGTTYESKDDQ